MNKANIEKLEDVNVTFSEQAFKPKVMYCDKCDRKMKKLTKEISVSKDVRVVLDVFQCPKGHEEMISIDQAKKLDKALIVNRLLLNKPFSFKRKLSYDGSNYVFRLPNELTRGKVHKEVIITPLERNEILVRW